jgi:hypothetical protein
VNQSSPENLGKNKEQKFAMVDIPSGRVKSPLNRQEFKQDHRGRRETVRIKTDFDLSNDRGTCRVTGLAVVRLKQSTINTVYTEILVQDRDSCESSRQSQFISSDIAIVSVKLDEEATKGLGLRLDTGTSVRKRTENGLKA